MINSYELQTFCRDKTYTINHLQCFHFFIWSCGLGAGQRLSSPPHLLAVVFHYLRFGLSPRSSSDVTLWISACSVLTVNQSSTVSASLHSLFLGWAGSNGVRVLQSSYPIILHCSGQVAALLHVHTHTHPDVNACACIYTQRYSSWKVESVCVTWQWVHSSLLSPQLTSVDSHRVWSLYLWLYIMQETPPLLC